MGSSLSVFHQNLNHILEMATERRAEYVDENNGYLLFQKIFIPEEVMSNILSYLDCRTLLCSRLVCHSWKDMVDNTALKLKAKRSHAKSLENLSQSQISKLDWYVFYAICKKDPFNKNLLINGCGQEGLNHWVERINGGDGWRVEGIPQGSDPVPEEINELSCFATSFDECKKSQIIPLVKHGLTAKIMDEIQPDIEFSEWYAGRFDCGSSYHLSVRLLDKQKKPVPDYIFNHDGIVLQWQGHEWCKVSHVFRDYGPGVRYILFSHSGKDSQFWKGYYGSKMTGGSVVLKLPENILY